MSAKSGNIAPFGFVNSAKFQKNSIKRVEDIFIFTPQVLRIRQILLVFASSFAQFLSAMFVFGCPCCIGFWDTYFVEETRKVTYSEHATCPRKKEKESP